MGGRIHSTAWAGSARFGDALGAFWGRRPQILAYWPSIGQNA